MSRKQTRQRGGCESYREDCVDITRLPPKVVAKARQVIEALHSGASLHQLRGKRFVFDRTLIGIPVTYRYRLLCRHLKAGIVPLKVMSHETYNAVVRNRRIMV